MKRSVIQRIIPLVFVVVIIGLVIAAIVSVVRIVIGSGSQPIAQTDTSETVLLNTTAISKVRMTIRGPIVGSEDFRTYQVSVTPLSREFIRYSGYLKQPIADKTYSNSIVAYDEFVHALSKANLAKGTAFSGEADDTRGICATGQVHEFEIIQNETIVKRLWTSTCKGSPGSLAADTNLLHVLFLAQVPDADQYIGKD